LAIADWDWRLPISLTIGDWSQSNRTIIKGTIQSAIANSIGNCQFNRQSPIANP
jgi:hypothetical protein